MHPEIFSIALFWFVTAYTPGPNNVVASYSGFNFGIAKTIPHILGVTLGFTSLVLFLLRYTYLGKLVKLAFFLKKIGAIVKVRGHFYIIHHMRCQRFYSITTLSFDSPFVVINITFFLSSDNSA